MRVSISESTHPGNLQPHVLLEELDKRYHFSVLRALWHHGLPDMVFTFECPLAYYSSSRGISATIPAKAFGGVSLGSESLTVAVPVSQKRTQGLVITRHVPEVTGEYDRRLLIARAALDSVRVQQKYCIDTISVEN